jgi:hypothetical protein
MSSGGMAIKTQKARGCFAAFLKDRTTLLIVE